MSPIQSERNANRIVCRSGLWTNRALATMSWNQKYWDMLANIYWTRHRYMGSETRIRSDAKEVGRPARITSAFQRTRFQLTPKFMSESGQKESGEAYRGLLNRLKLGVVSWSDFDKSMSEIVSDLAPHRAGDQTLIKLLEGFQAQLRDHDGTGIEENAIGQN